MRTCVSTYVCQNALNFAKRVLNVMEITDFRNLYYKVQFCLCVSLFNSSETAGGRSTKLGTINHHPVVSVIRVLVTSS